MSSIYSKQPLDFSRLNTVSIHDRTAKVKTADFCRPLTGIGSVSALIDAMPRLLAGADLRSVVSAIQTARANRRAILWGLGGHVIKTGLAPVLTELMDAGFATGFAMNGSASIHDYEIGLVGSTSEDVESVLPNGSFGTSDETGRQMNIAIRKGITERLGMGEALGRTLALIASPLFRGDSLLVRAYEAKVPVTIHVALGTDTLHIHPAADGAAIGASSLQDFQLFTGLVTDLNEGGVYINVGSAVVMPEVFLKALSAARNLGYPVQNFTTVNMDFLQHYRPKQNVVSRPHAGLSGGQGYALTGHHEIMLPLLAAALLHGGHEKP